ncbi:MAG: RNA polymerase sigma-70 factor [Tannerella sp.]|jgi:RNA polymerase sigma-70 factor (ECF subfamily)|nr:RNA polymerase sigma-70 factor [Tannerella sp.]
MDTYINCRYREVYLEYAPLLLRFAEKFVSQFYAEDIVHDVFLKLWDKQIFLLPENELKRVLYVAVKNACIDLLRRFALEQEYIDERRIQLQLDELDFFEASDELFMRKDLLHLLLQKIEELPERSREIFKMSYLEGMKTTEIAEQLNISTRTVENHLYRALIFLRKATSHFFIYLFILLSKN